MTFRVTVLGSSSAMPTLKRNPSAHALNVHEQFFLIDCGEGTQTRLFRCGISPLRLGTVFLTHLHGDHVYGLFGLMSTLGLLGRRTPLKIFAPRPFDRILASHLSFFDSKLPYEVQWEEIDTRAHRLLYENKTLEVWSIPLRHRVPAAGFLFREKTPPLNIRKEAVGLYGLGIAQCRAAKRGEDVLLDDGTVVPNAELTYVPYRRRSYAYLSDTLYSPRAAELVRGVDLLYHEATFADPDKAMARKTGHSTAAQAAKAALKAGAGKLLIGHFSSRYPDVEVLVNEARNIFPATEAVVEGESYDIRPVMYGAQEQAAHIGMSHKTDAEVIIYLTFVEFCAFPNIADSGQFSFLTVSSSGFDYFILSGSCLFQMVDYSQSIFSPVHAGERTHKVIAFRA